MATQVFQNPGAPYLQTSPSDIPSPLNIGIENSRRFRALPVYANLVAYGRDGYRDMLERQIRLARKIAKFIDEHDAYELLPALEHGKRTSYEDIFIIVLFRAKRHDMNTHLVQQINSSRQIYISGTAWGGQPAARFAVRDLIPSLGGLFEVYKRTNKWRYRFQTGKWMRPEIGQLYEMYSRRPLTAIYEVHSHACIQETSTCI